MISISRVHLGRVVKDLNITLKQTRLRHEPKTLHKKPISIKNVYISYILGDIL